MLEKVREVLFPSLISSATSVGLYHFWLKESLTDKVPLLNYEFPAYITVGVSSLVGSITGQVVGMEIKNKIPQYPILGNAQEMIVGAVIDGTFTYGAMAVLVHKDVSFMNAFSLGAVGSVAGNLVNHGLPSSY